MTLQIYIFGQPMGAAALVRWALAAPDTFPEHDHGQEADAEAPDEAEGLQGRQEGLRVAAAPRPM